MGWNHLYTRGRGKRLGSPAARAGDRSAVEPSVVLFAVNRLRRRSNFHSSLVALFLLQHSLWPAIATCHCLWTGTAHLLCFGADRPKDNPATAVERGLDSHTGLLRQRLAGCASLSSRDSRKWRCKDRLRTEIGR